MEFKEGAVKPPSTRSLLRQQINEQSEHCDVTVKIGEWSKKFHWCILVASPFFEAIYRNRYFQEQSTGIIELHIQHTYTIVEDAILFLYGRRPKITIKNIGGLLEIAEFLLLPTLKAQCVQWLKNAHASCENCFQILHLASLFDLYLPRLEEFIRGNLLELLDKDVAVTLDKETIIDIFKDSDLSYVSVKQWFRFLVSWTKADLRREAYFAELFSLLDVSDVDEESHKEILGETFVTRLVPSILENIKPSFGETTQVIVFPSSYWTPSTACFVIGSGKWCKIHRDLTDVIGIEDKTSPIVYKWKGYRSSTIICHDLSRQNENETTTEPVDKETGSALDDIKKTLIVQSKCYAVARQRVDKKQATEDTGTEVDPEAVAMRTISLVMAFGLEYHEAQSIAIQESVRSVLFPFAARMYKYVINLYRGDLQEGQTSMEPLVCFLEESTVSDLVVDMNNNIAVLLKEKDEIIIFNDAECFVERINLRKYTGNLDDGDLRLTARECGFVLINNSKVCCISRVHGPSLQNRFQVTLFSIPEPRKYMSLKRKYIICGDVCFRLLKTDYDADVTFSYTNVDNLKTAMTEEAHWVKEDLPDSCKKKLGNDIGTSAFMVTLPKQMLRCSLYCPHCVAENRRTKRGAEDYIEDSDDYSDSVNEYCGYAGRYGYDSDDYPYYSD